jgi:DNA repair exonuclease SbcCD ATPase subunit
MRLKPARERWGKLAERGGPSVEEARARLAELRERQHAAVRTAAAVRAARELWEKREREREEARAEAGRLDVAVRVAARAAAVFGKGGAQRRFAEGELAGIERLACEMMADAGLPLGVRVSWSREGSGVAATCAECGDAFPRSEKVKACARCGAARGPNLVHKLEVEPTAQSGGARDLAGIFLQLAAAAWLVRERGARWATAMLDEPLAALDRAIRRQLSAHFPEVLRRVGCAQALVIGHDRGALDALPGRIQVTSRGGWSAASVVA